MALHRLLLLFKGDDYNEESPTEPSSYRAAAEEEITHDIRGRPPGHHLLTIY